MPLPTEPRRCSKTLIIVKNDVFIWWIRGLCVPLQSATMGLTGFDSV